jgi:hypothetical protein
VIKAGGVRWGKLLTDRVAELYKFYTSFAHRDKFYTIETTEMWKLYWFFLCGGLQDEWGICVQFYPSLLELQYYCTHAQATINITKVLAGTSSEFGVIEYDAAATVRPEQGEGKQEINMLYFPGSRTRLPAFCRCEYLDFAHYAVDPMWHQLNDGSLGVYVDPEVKFVRALPDIIYIRNRDDCLCDWQGAFSAIKRGERRDDALQPLRELAATEIAVFTSDVYASESREFFLWLTDD